MSLALTCCHMNATWGSASGDLRQVGQILFRATAPLLRVEVDHVCGAPVGTEIATFAVKHHVELGIASPEHEGAGDERQLLLHEAWVEPDPLGLAVHLLAMLGHEIEQGLVGGGHAGALEHLERPIVDQVLVGLLEHREADVAGERLDALGHQTTAGIVSASAS